MIALGLLAVSLAFNLWLIRRVNELRGNAEHTVRLSKTLDALERRRAGGGL